MEEQGTELKLGLDKREILQLSLFALRCNQ